MEIGDDGNEPNSVRAPDAAESTSSFKEIGVGAVVEIPPMIALRKEKGFFRISPMLDLAASVMLDTIPS